MRVKPEHVARLREAIAPLDTPERRAAYATARFPRADAVRDLDKRYRWDLYYAAGSYRILGDDGDYATAHLDTALRRIVPTLEET